MMSKNIQSLIGIVKDQVKDMTDVKSQLQALKDLKDIIFEDLEEQLSSVYDKLEVGFSTIKDELRKEFTHDRELLRKDLLEAMESMKSEMSLDFDLDDPEEYSVEDIKKILEELKVEDVGKFMKRSFVTEYMTNKLAGKVLPKESWYTLYKTIRKNL